MRAAVRTDSFAPGRRHLHGGGGGGGRPNPTVMIGSESAPSRQPDGDVRLAGEAILPRVGHFIPESGRRVTAISDDDDVRRPRAPYLTRATVTVDGTVVVRDGRLVAPPVTNVR